MTKITLDQESIDDATMIVAVGFSRYPQELGMDVGFCLAFRSPGSRRPHQWYYQLLVLKNRPEPRLYLPAAARLYRRIKSRDDVRADLRFKDCVL